MRKSVYIIILVAVLFALLFPYLLAIPPLKQILVAHLAQKTNSTIAIDRLRFSWLGPQVLQGITVSNPNMNGKIEQVVLKTPFWHLNSYPYPLALSGGSFQVHTPKLAAGSIDQIQAAIDQAKVDASGITSINGEEGSFSIQGMAISPTNFDLTFFAKQMPTDLIDWLIEANGNLTGMLGAFFNLDGTANRNSENGKLSASLSSPKTGLSVQANFTPKSLTLDAPLSVKFPLPPFLVDTFAKKGITFNDPIALYINPEGFSLPLPITLENFSIGNASISLGKITIPKPKSVDALSTFLKSQQLASSPKLEVWVAPFAFRFNVSHSDQGLLHLNRVDALLANSLHLCSWGPINTLSDQLDLILGIPAETLEKTGLVSQLPSDYVLHVNVGGTLSNPQFDRSLATTKLAALVAAEHAQAAAGKLGPLAGLAGNVVNKIAQPEPTPEPYKQPFPWQQR